MTPHPPPWRSPRGFLIGDAVLALFIAMVLFMALVALVAHGRKAERRLSAVRASVRDVESALLTLQATGARPPDLRLERLPAAAPAGQVWVRASLQKEDLPDRPLVALVPERALDATTAGGGGGSHP
jgi:hypothetical protein